MLVLLRFNLLHALKLDNEETKVFEEESKEISHLMESTLISNEKPHGSQSKIIELNEALKNIRGGITKRYSLRKFIHGIINKPKLKPFSEERIKEISKSFVQRIYVYGEISILEIYLKCDKNLKILKELCTQRISLINEYFITEYSSSNDDLNNIFINCIPLKQKSMRIYCKLQPFYNIKDFFALRDVASKTVSIKLK